MRNGSKKKYLLTLVVVLVVICCFKLMSVGDMANDIALSERERPSHLSQYIAVNGVTYHYTMAGEGELILLLHGFPYFGESWAPIMKPLSKHYKVIALDNKGYGFSDKPKDISAYRMQSLVEDIRQLVLELSPNQKITIIGHDWGGVLTWAIVQKYPDLVKQVVVINAPPLNVLLTQLAQEGPQRAASSYIDMLTSWWIKWYFYFKGPELLWGDSLKQLIKDGHVPQSFKNKFLKYWAQKGAAEGAINWYIANIPEFDNITSEDHWPSKKSRVSVPSLLIWSNQDKAFVQETLDAIPAYVDQLTVSVLETNSHSPHLDHTANVLKSINGFIK